MYKAIVIPVLANDYDIEADTITIKSVSPATAGITIIVPNGILYYPYKRWVGTDHFTCTIQDPSGAQSTANVTVSVTKH